MRVAIGETVIREEMGPGEIFGEMSFLGRFQTSASVVSNLHNTEILSIKTSVLNSIFASDSELFFHFYWWMAENLANRLQSLSDLVFKKKQSGSAPSKTDDGSPIAKKLLTVSVETVLPGSEYPILRSISVDQKITVSEFIILCATRFTIPSHLHASYNLFKVDGSPFLFPFPFPFLIAFPSLFLFLSLSFPLFSLHSRSSIIQFPFILPLPPCSFSLPTISFKAYSPFAFLPTLLLLYLTSTYFLLSPSLMYYPFAFLPSFPWTSFPFEFILFSFAFSLCTSFVFLSFAFLH